MMTQIRSPRDGRADARKREKVASVARRRADAVQVYEARDVVDRNRRTVCVCILHNNATFPLSRRGTALFANAQTRTYNVWYSNESAKRSIPINF
uniref:Uncharacterized protein n=1 Tax=Trichogramma kaykai TaxID=54128 RepID=A0ABD2VV34_9HYME